MFVIVATCIMLYNLYIAKNIWLKMNGLLKKIIKLARRVS